MTLGLPPRFFTFSLVLLLLEQTVSLYSSLLGPYNISDVTLSGFSSGGFMTVQFHVAHSSIIKGAAAFAGGPYYCAQGNGTKLATDCSFFTKNGPDLNKLIEYTKQFESEGKIDPTSNLYDDQIFVWVGSKDTFVGPTVSISLEDYYRNFVDGSRLKYDHTFPAQHTMPTLDYGVECTKLRPPAIGKCNYDGAGEVLQHLIGPLVDAGQPIPENLMEFDQTPYFPTDNDRHSLGDKGFIYVPSSCQDSRTSCHLHISFHGCTQTEMRWGNLWADKTGYNRWAESNNIIVLYPNAANSLDPLNPMGCWDCTGYSGSDYILQSGAQIRFIRSLITEIAGF